MSVIEAYGGRVWIGGEYERFCREQLSKWEASDLAEWSLLRNPMDGSTDWVMDEWGGWREVERVPDPTRSPRCRCIGLEDPAKWHIWEVPFPWITQKQEDRMQTTIWDVTVYDVETGEIIEHTRVSARSRELVLTRATLFTETEAGLVSGDYEAIINLVATAMLREPRRKAAEKDEG